MVTPFTADGDARPRPGRRARRRTWSTRATTASSSPARPARRRRRPTPRRPTCCAPSSTPSATARTSSPASAPTTPRTPSSWRRAAEKAGAHGLLVVTPVLQQAAAGGPARATSSAVADATGLPVMLYDIPGRTGVALAAPRRCCGWPSTRRSSPSRTPRTTSVAAQRRAGARPTSPYYSRHRPAQPAAAGHRRGRRRQRRRPRRRRPAARRAGRRRTTPATSARARELHQQLLPVYRGHVPHPGRRSWPRRRSRCSASRSAPCGLPLVDATDEERDACSRADLAAGGRRAAHEPPAPRARPAAAARRTAACASSRSAGSARSAAT